ncbi:unnamed protein product [Albugo candida]|uniref:Uncharacterized protein n=1 Tax=Albugo candida TaxID=65357 RepID=A0A024GVZ0_9STRA|nr:unnamed protein product [Albugo candida]|eukprot:CCI50724.1 unnamed protein product [Albugo candida]
MDGKKVLDRFDILCTLFARCEITEKLSLFSIFILFLCGRIAFVLLYVYHFKLVYFGNPFIEMSFLQRFVSYFINDVAVKALANNRAFQQFALKTHYRVNDVKNIASEGAENLVETWKRTAPRVKEFTSALKEEIARDMRNKK